jgi:hypothetical protein
MPDNQKHSKNQKKWSLVLKWSTILFSDHLITVHLDFSVPASRSRQEEEELGCKLDITLRSLFDLLLLEAGDMVRFRPRPPKRLPPAEAPVKMLMMMMMGIRSFTLNLQPPLFIRYDPYPLSAPVFISS